MRGGTRKGAGGGDKTCEALSHQGLEKLLRGPSVDYSHTLPLFVLFISYLRSLQLVTIHSLVWFLLVRCLSPPPPNLSSRTAGTVCVLFTTGLSPQSRHSEYVYAWMSESDLDLHCWYQVFFLPSISAPECLQVPELDWFVSSQIALGRVRFGGWWGGSLWSLSLDGRTPVQRHWVVALPVQEEEGTWDS